MERKQAQTQKRPMFWRWVIVLSISIGFGWQWLPPEGRPMVEVFEAEAIEKNDGTFDLILGQIKQQQAQAEGGELTFGQWEEAIGTASLTNYFPLKQFKLDKAAREKLGLNDGLAMAHGGDPTDEQRRELNRFVLSRIQAKAAGKVKLGLDLRGGTQFAVSVTHADMNGSDDQHRDSLDQAMEILRKRIDKFGVSEPIIQSAGTDRIIIQIPGLSKADRDRARSTIEKIAKLEFRTEHPGSRDALARGEDFVPGAELMTYTFKTEDGGQGTAQLFVVTMQDHPDKCVSGKHIVRAYPLRDSVSGLAEIAFQLNAEGANKFAKITDAHKTRGLDPRKLCIVLDGKLISAPDIISRIHANGRITGDFTFEEARELANSLENPLETPVKIEEVRDVDPSLGKDSINKGFAAAKWGLIAVAVFMLIYYLLSGFVANVALALNILILMGVLCWFDATLTLPGIAGVVLTIGMAVDANVLIFERIREELRAGKSLKGAIASGYEKAFGTIFDANLTTLIASVILIYMGKGPVQGFGVTLTIGIIASMFTALVATRLLLDGFIRLGWIGSEASKRAMHLRPSAGLPRIDFVKYKVGATRAANALKSPMIWITWVIILCSSVYVVSRGWDKVMGVDFAGGHSLLMEIQQDESQPNAADTGAIAQAIESGQLRDGLAAATGVDGAQLQIQMQVDPSGDKQYVRLDFPLSAQQGVDASGAMQQALAAQMPDVNFRVSSDDLVGPSISGEIQKSALVAVVLALFGILIYVAFRYEYSFAVGAVIAILHDVLMTGSIFFLSGRELNAPIVAAILTIIGFSINDTIVIFDRIRENLRLGTRGTFADVMNAALNQTLSRTIITSGTTLLSTGTLYFFGGTVINDFAFMFLVGILTGTYSSIYIACAVVLWWHEGKRPELAAPIQDADPVPAQA